LNVLNHNSLAVDNNLSLYVLQEKLSHESELLHKAGRRLLDYAVKTLHLNYLVVWEAADMIKQLVKHGADSNETFTGWIA
jgi:hypothetical protein